MAPLQPVGAISGNQPDTKSWPEAERRPNAVLGRDASCQDPAMAADAEEQEGPGGALRGGRVPAKQRLPPSAKKL